MNRRKEIARRECMMAERWKKLKKRKESMKREQELKRRNTKKGEARTEGKV